MSSFQVVAAGNQLDSVQNSLQSATLIDADPLVEQSGSSNPMIYSGEVVRALKAANRLASSGSELDPSPHNIDTPAIPDGGEGEGDQSID